MSTLTWPLHFNVIICMMMMQAQMKNMDVKIGMGNSKERKKNNFLMVLNVERDMNDSRKKNRSARK